MLLVVAYPTVAAPATPPVRRTFKVTVPAVSEAVTALVVNCTTESVSFSVITAFETEPTTLPTPLVKLTVKVFSPSTSVSFRSGTVKVLVATPAANVIVPLVLVKSTPLVAELSVV